MKFLNITSLGLCLSQLLSFKSHNFKSGFIHTPESIREAQKTLFLIAQKELKDDLDGTRKRFAKYNPVIDGEGLIRDNGRLKKIAVPEELKYPILLPYCTIIFNT